MAKAYFTCCSVFRLHPCCSMCQNLLPSKDWTTFHYVYLCIYHIFFRYISVVGYLAYLVVFALVNNATVTLGLKYILWNSAFTWVHFSFSPLSFASLLFTAICKASSDNYFAFFAFPFLGSCSWSLPSVQCHEPLSIALQALYQM